MKIGIDIGVRKVHIGALLNPLLYFLFWSKETEADYYASIEDDADYYSLTEIE